MKIAFVMAQRFEIKPKSAHIDGTSVSVQGKYLSSEEEQVKPSSSEDKQNQDEEDSEPVPITITHGYSRDKRPDLKQYTLSLLTAEEGIPLFMQLGDGNELDQNAFAKMIKAFKAEWQGEEPEVYVMDAAFYTEENLSNFEYSIKWISRVPLTIKASLELTQTLAPEQFTKSTMYEGYRFCSVCNEYAGIKQLWVVVESDERKKADLKALLKRIDKSLASKMKSLKTLESKEFTCEADALSAAADFEKSLKYHLLRELEVVSKPHYQRRGRPRTGDEVSHYTYHIQATLIENEIAVKNYSNQAGRFILATNLLEEETNFTTDGNLKFNKTQWTEDLILKEYKAQ